METLKSCPLCGEAGPFKVHVASRDYLISHEMFYVQRCGICGFLFTNPRPTADEMPEFYQSDEYISHAQNPVSLQDKVYMGVKQVMLKQKLRTLTKHLNYAFGGRISEVFDPNPGEPRTDQPVTPNNPYEHSSSQHGPHPNPQHPRTDQPVTPNNPYEHSSSQHPPHTNSHGYRGNQHLQESLSHKQDKTWDEQKSTPDKFKILDYGCGTGSFVHSAAKKGIDAIGYEPEPSAREIADKKGVRVIGSESEMGFFPDQSFHAITLWHVIEHLHDFKEKLNDFYRLLKPGGVLLLAAPMANSCDAAIYGKYWAAWDLPRHILHFTPDTLKRAGKDAGFEYKENKPLPFDAWYIALLSEQNKQREEQPEKVTGGPAALPALKAGARGSWSNLKALIGSSPWSSQIFVFRK